MRVLGLLFGLLLLAPVSAQAPPPRAPARQAKARPPVKPDATLAQLMRGLMFPNSNILFDVQVNDPGVEKQLTDDVTRGALSTFANIYPGWEVVQNAARVLEEAPDLIMKPGRLCSNGKPVPLGDAQFRQGAQGLREAARFILKAAEEKNQEKVSNATNELIEACLNCHKYYRNTPPGGEFRCVSHLDPNGR